MLEREHSRRYQHIDTFTDEAVGALVDISSIDIDQFIDKLFEAWKLGSTIFIVGNGGSASTSVHFASDLNNATDRFPKVQRVRAVSLNENLSRISALTNDKGWGEVYTQQLENFFRDGDVVLGISVHGGSGADAAGVWSQNLLSALQYAKDHNGHAIGFTGFDGGVMKTLCDVCVNVPIRSTPHVEGIHVVLHHLVCTELTRRIGEITSED